MAQQIIGTAWDSDNRSRMNHNFTELYDWLNSFVLEAGDSSAEVIQARGAYDLLYQRLDAFEALLGDKSENTDVTSAHTKIDRTQAKLAEIAAPMPAKTGESKSSPKIVKKVSATELRAFQALNENNGYLEYTLKSGNGGNGATDTAVNYELLRLQKVQAYTDGYVWHYVEPDEGALAEVVAPSKAANETEKMFLFVPSGAIDESKNVSSLTGDVGIGVKTIPAASTHTWHMAQTEKRTLEVCFRTSETSSDDIDILVGGVVKANVSAQSRPTYQPNGFMSVTVNMDNWHYTSYGTTFQVQIRNNHASATCEFIGFNIKKIRDWQGEQINNYKFISSNKTFLDAVGASDYAIKDKDTGKWLGSYHGGETSELCQLHTYWDATNHYASSDAYIRTYDFATMAETWTLTTMLQITQKTDLNGKAKALSRYDFNKDGSMEMDMSVYNSSILTTDFYTALTATHTGFDALTYPKYETIPSGAETYFDIQEGKIIQRNTAAKMELTSRFTRFVDLYNDTGAFINQNSTYSKAYYGVVQKWDAGVRLENVGFSKGLDFALDWY